jgi:hypothetical protein
MNLLWKADSYSILITILVGLLIIIGYWWEWLFMGLFFCLWVYCYYWGFWVFGVIDYLVDCSSVGKYQYNDQ